MSQPLRILHFADAHIDIANYGRHDPESGLPVRVMDFLKSLDEIINTAIQEKVDLVLFGGDTYKDRNPHPTFQREWGLRMMKLSMAKIPTMLLVGNHDVSPAIGRSHTLQEFKTLGVPFIYVADEIQRWTPEQLKIPVQIISIPWISRSTFMTKKDTFDKSAQEIISLIEEKVGEKVEELLQQIDPEFPTIILAHASVQDAVYSSERTVMLGQELILRKSLLTGELIDYVALGHIHKHQSLNADQHPPIVYPGSIERINFGEVNEEKGYVMVELTKGKTNWEFRLLKTRPFLDFKVENLSQDDFMEDIFKQLPEPDEVDGKICRLQITYPREWESLLDDAAITRHFHKALSFQIQKQRQSKERVRLEKQVETLKPQELLATYWEIMKVEQKEQEELQLLAKDIFSEVE